MKKYILLLALLATCNVSKLFAQHKPSEKLQKFVEKKMETKGIQVTKTHRLKAKKYNAPKKIGILVFGVAGSKEYKYNDGWYDHFVTISKDAATIVAQGIHDVSIEEVKKMYAAQGVEILTPNEYLDTEAKREAYNTMDMEIRGLAKITAKAGTPDQIGLPDGYKYFTNSWLHSDIGARADIVEELKMFGMDGYLSIFVEFYGPYTVSQIRSNLIIIKDRNYVSKIKNKVFRRSDIAQKVLPMSYTQILASERDKLKKGTSDYGRNGRDRMISFDNNELWIDPNIAKVIAYSTNLYFPMVK